MDRNPARVEKLKENVEFWSDQLASLRRALPTEVSLQKLVQDDIPLAEKDVEDATAKLGPATAKAEEVSGFKRPVTSSN